MNKTISAEKFQKELDALRDGIASWNVLNGLDEDQFTIEVRCNKTPVNWVWLTIHAKDWTVLPITDAVNLYVRTIQYVETKVNQFPYQGWEVIGEVR